ncbi:hypothetical protein KFZ68_20565 (plasmid) [Photobacterium damselae]|uniref:hypothetical protein n=1 Tax=Photobacterium damselae TaxID=38293 RepID=UPI002542DDFD
MSKKDFDSFLSKHEKQQQESTIDWIKQKDEWLDYIDAFYKQIETWFTPYIKDERVSYSYSPKALVEDHIGSYNVKNMKIDFAGQSVVLEPVGTLLIGTKGRIDMEGARGRVQFILADKNSPGFNVRASINKPRPEEKPKDIKWVWKLVLRDSRSVKFEDFNESNFFDALMEIIYA